VKLPRADRASIESAKIRDYLLSKAHPIGRFKFDFFAALGYSEREWPRLRIDLLKLAVTGEAGLGKASEYGQKYEVHGRLTGPSGREAEIVSVWIVLEGEETPRFVTAFPGGKA